jgi:hypothetical protein
MTLLMFVFDNSVAIPPLLEEKVVVVVAEVHVEKH